MRQIKVLITQAENAIDNAVSDGDMTQGDADPLRDLLTQSFARYAPWQRLLPGKRDMASYRVLAGKPQAHHIQQL